MYSLLRFDSRDNIASEIRHVLGHEEAYMTEVVTFDLDDEVAPETRLGLVEEPLHINFVCKLINVAMVK